MSKILLNRMARHSACSSTPEAALSQSDGSSSQPVWAHEHYAELVQRLKDSSIFNVVQLLELTTFQSSFRERKPIISPQVRKRGAL